MLFLQRQQLRLHRPGHRHLQVAERYRLRGLGRKDQLALEFVVGLPPEGFGIVAQRAALRNAGQHLDGLMHVLIFDLCGVPGHAGSEAGQHASGIDSRLTSRSRGLD